MLDAHKNILGTGEDSIFNANLDSFRNDIVSSINNGNIGHLQEVIEQHGSFVEEHMLKVARKVTTDSAKKKAASARQVVIDKMLFNYRNIGA